MGLTFDTKTDIFKYMCKCKTLRPVLGPHRKWKTCAVHFLFDVEKKTCNKKYCEFSKISKILLTSWEAATLNARYKFVFSVLLKITLIS